MPLRNRKKKIPDAPLDEPLLTPSRTEQEQEREPAAPHNAESQPDPGPLTAIQRKAWDVVTSLFDILPSSFVRSHLVPPVPSQDRSLLIDFQEHFLVAFDREAEAHMDLVRTLWHSATRLQPPHCESTFAGPAEPVDQGPPEMNMATMKSELWKQYGFQGVDPGTDFRGAGLLGLRNLVFLCTNYPALWCAMQSEEYPAAVACINVTMELLNILHLTRGRRTCLDTTHADGNYTACRARLMCSRYLAEETPRGPSDLPPPVVHEPPTANCSAERLTGMEAVFSELFAIACSVLQKHWSRGTKNLMEFNTVLHQARDEFETLLRDAESYDAVMLHRPR